MPDDTMTLQQRIQQLRDEIAQGWADYYAQANDATNAQQLEILQAEADRLEAELAAVPTFGSDSSEPTNDEDQLQAVAPEVQSVKYPVGFLESVEANAAVGDVTPTHVTEVEFTDGPMAPGVTPPETDPDADKDDDQLGNTKKVADPHPGLNASTDEWVAFYKEQGEDVPEEPKRNELRDAWLKKHPDPEA